MLTMHLFFRNIKTPITLPSPWLNVTFKIVRLNFSSSSGSSSDSDSDAESPKSNAVVNEHDARKDKGLKPIDYRLYATNMKDKQKQLDKELSKLAAALAETEEEDKNIIFSNILNSISHMQQNYQLKQRTKVEKQSERRHNVEEGKKGFVDKAFRSHEEVLEDIREIRNQIEKRYRLKGQFMANIKKDGKMEEELSVISILKRQQQKARSSEEQVKAKPEMEQEPSVIRSLQNQQQKVRSSEEQVKAKPEMEQEPSVIRSLQNQQQKARSSEKQVETKPEMEQEPSVIRSLQNQQQKARSSEEQVKAKPEMEQEPSVIRSLQNQQQKARSSEEQVKAKPEMEEEPSVIRSLRNQQQKARSSEEQVKTKPEIEQEPSVIRSLRNQRQKARSSEEQVKAKPEMEQEPSVSRSLRNQRQKARSSEEQVKAKPEMEQEPSVSRSLRNQRQKTRSSEEQVKAKPEMQQEPSVSRSLKNQQHKARRVSRVTSEFESEGLSVQSQQQSSKAEVEKLLQELPEKVFVNEFTETSAFPELKTWDKCEDYNLQILMTQHPKNAFEEMIKWTEEGILWHFPINNEQGLKGEENVHFSEHVFLDKHLEGWCPSKGPIRHYMELVCVGLSKNPYMTVKEKIGHIMWYKDYFGNKQDLLKKMGLIE